MRCPRCGHLDDRVVDSRQTREGDLIRRRRECVQCAMRFTTYERVELMLPVIVKRAGRREPFDRAKVLRALRTACRKRDIHSDVLDGVADRVEWALAATGEREVPAGRIGELLVEELRRIDGVAYLRFASVYHSYDSVDAFLREVNRVQAAAADAPDDPPPTPGGDDDKGAP